jgi:hypothetical protein
MAASDSADWLDLAVELDCWEEAGLVARLWWRDDDAVTPTPQLDRLLAVAGDTPLALAVIPADASAGLAQALALFPEVSVLHHGWCHANRAAGYLGGKKSEYPAERHPVDVADELEEGRQRLRSLFGPRALPVFVPPWNRFAPRFVPLLIEAGFTALSQMAPSKGESPQGMPGGVAAQIGALDVHVDVIDWRGGRGFAGAGAALRGLVAALRRERQGACGPVGILTHHLVMDEPSEAFMVALADMVSAHSASRWTDPRDLVRRRAVAP